MKQSFKKANVPESVNSNSKIKTKPVLPDHYFRKSSTPKPLEAMDVRTFVKMPIPKPDPLLGDWLMKPSLSMIHAPRGIGKTYLGLSIGCSVAAGQKLFGWECMKSGKVHYLDGEMSSGSLQSRFKTIPKRMRPAQGMFNLSTPDFQPGFLPDLSSRDGQEMINHGIDADTDLIIVDNLSSWSKSGREDSETWAPIAEWALRHRSEGRSIIFIHHSGKNGTQRGTSRKEDLLDVVLALRRPPEYSPSDGASFEIHFEKNRHLVGDVVAPIKVRWAKNEDGNHDWEWEVVQEQSNAMLERIIKLKEQGLNQSEIALELGVNRSTVSRALKGHKG